MRIGLYDVNKSSYGKMRYEFPEIDLMKVYSYYKKNKNNIIELCQDYTKYKNYDLFYCFNNKRHIISKNLLQLEQEPNVFLIGTCFYGDIWIPMDDEIEHCEPDITSYSQFLRTTIINDTLAPWVANLFTDYYYLRYYYPNWHWNLISSKIKNKKVILYDFDLTSNENWQELCLRIKKDSSKNFVCRHELILRTIQDLEFVTQNELYKTSTKYPTKFIIDIPEFLENSKSFIDNYFYLFKNFPARSLFIYQNHYKQNETPIEKLQYLCDSCMYMLEKGKRLYPIYDYSQIPTKYDYNFKRLDYYFLMEKPGTVLDILLERGDLIGLIDEIKKENPALLKQMSQISRAGVKAGVEKWIYGIK